jgi:hypothetical protein
MLLTLSLYKEYFDQILSGEKKIEYRQRSEHWDKRLSKQYDTVKFINGYGNDRPWLVCQVTKIEKDNYEWRVHLGEVLDSGNLKSRSTRKPAEKKPTEHTAVKPAELAKPEEKKPPAKTWPCSYVPCVPCGVRRFNR